MRNIKGPTQMAMENTVTLERPAWVSEEEFALVRRKSTGIEWMEGTPEADATFFYTDEAHKEGVAINYDEEKAGLPGRDFELPDPLVFANGRKVSDANDWSLRRKEILGIFEREVYGRMPPQPESMSFELISEKVREEFSMVERRYRQWFSADGCGPAIDWIVFIPLAAKRPYPFFIHLNYIGNDKIAEGRTNHFPLPLAEMASRGYAFMSANYKQISSDGNSVTGTAFDGVFELWGLRDPKRDDNTGSLMAWAWGLCRGLDLAGRVPELDSGRCAVIGSSRLGKAALLAAAFDERFKACIPNQTGAIGVQLMKRDYGESLAAQELNFRWWYCGGVWKWKGREREMPFDQHMLLACVAPRALLLECYHKRWFDPVGEFLSAKAASPVWEILTGKGLGLEDWPEPYDTVAVRPPFGYVRRTGTHGLSPDDWTWAMAFADQVL